MENKKFIDGLKKQLQEIEILLKTNRKDPKFDGWKTKTARLLERIFGKDSSHLKDFKEVRYSLGVFFGSTPDYEFEKAYKKGLNNAKSVLNSIIEELEEFGLPNKEAKESTRKSNEVTVNLNQTLNINVNTVLENNLTVSQYKKLNDILKISDKNKKENMLSNFLISLGSSGAIEILKSILLST